MSAEQTFRYINEINRDLADYLRTGKPRYLRKDLEELKLYLRTLATKSQPLKELDLSDKIDDLLRKVSEPESDRIQKYRGLNTQFRTTIVEPLLSNRHFLDTDFPSAPLQPLSVVPTSVELLRDVDYSEDVPELETLSSSESRELRRVISFLEETALPEFERALTDVRVMSDVGTTIIGISEMEKSGNPVHQRIAGAARKIIYRSSSVALWLYKARGIVYRITELPQALQHMPNLNRDQLQKLFKTLPSLKAETKVIGQAKTAEVSRKLIRAFGQWSLGYKHILEELGDSVPAHLRLTRIDTREGQEQVKFIDVLLLALEALRELEVVLARIVGILRRVIPAEEETYSRAASRYTPMHGPPNPFTRCSVCGKVFKPSSRNKPYYLQTCPECAEDLPENKRFPTGGRERCMRCDKPIPHGVGKFCNECRSSRPPHRPFYAVELGRDSFGTLTAQIRRRRVPAPTPTRRRLVPIPEVPGFEPAAPEEVIPGRKLTRMQAIAVAGRNNLLVRIDYEKLRDTGDPEAGTVKTYTLEPYSFRIRHTKKGRRRYFFGHDVADDHIKMYATPNIKRVEVLAQRFDPRWEVEV